MDIVRKSQSDIYSAPLCEGSLVHRELMGDHYMLLVFNSAEAQHFRLGDYCDTDFGRFELTDLYEPEYNEDGGFKYQLRLDAYYMKWKNKIVKFTPSNQQSEMAFTLTRDLAGHMELFMANLTYLGTKDSSYLFNGSTVFTYDIDYSHISKKMMPVSYDSLSLIDALNQYASLWECEWWVVDNVIHLGRCEGSVNVATFKLNDNVAQMSRAQGSKQYITRLYVFGSERNIPSNYRKEEGATVVNGVVQRRLMLPAGTPYLQVAGITEEQAVEGVLILDEVYPRTQCKVGAVSTYVSKGTDEDGNETTETFYRVSDTSGFIDSIDNDMRLDGDSFHIRFTSGKMNGMEFECNLIANDQRIGRCFEVIANEDYGIKLPRENFCPAVDDEYIIFGWDATKISNTNLITSAEQELVTEGNKYLAKSQVDPSEYTCTMISKKMQDIGMPVKYGRDANIGNDQYVPIPYDLGDKVQMDNPALFGSSRSSRIIGYEIKLDIPADSPQFIVGESLRYSRSGAMESKLDELTYEGNLYTGAGGYGGGSVYVIGTGDTTPASNKNVYSAIRSDNQYARKDRNDVIKSLWTFKNGNGVKRGLQTEDYLLNTNEGNLFGKGFELVSQTNALGDTRTRLEVDELFVRIKAFFASLEIREISYVGGNYIFSAAGSKIYYVEWLDSQGHVIDKNGGAIGNVYTFRCYLYSDDGTTATINKWALNDQVMCRTFNIDAGVHQNVSNKYYWRRATGVGQEIIKTKALAAVEKQYLADVEAINNWQVMTDEERVEQAQALADLEEAYELAKQTVKNGGVPDGAADDMAFTSYQYVDISMTDCDLNSDFPEDDDTIVQFGNWTNTARQGIIYLQVEGEGSPAIMEYSKVGLSHFTIPEPNLLLSPKKNVIYGEFHSVVDSEGGNTGSGDSIADQLAALIASLNDIQNQADKKFELWFAPYAPLPSISFDAVEDTDGKNPAEEGWYECVDTNIYETTRDATPVAGKTYLIKTDNNTSVNYPASEWITEALKALHVQDLFYDTFREPASEGGRAWRWTTISVDGVIIDRWIIVTDQDTLDSLEKISDVASDGRLTGGAEKTRVYIDWMKAVQDYQKYEEQARDYGLNNSDYYGEGVNIYQAYITAFKKLARLLNGDDTTSESLYVADEIMNGTTAPAWLADLTSTTDIPSPVIYRQIWNTYYSALAALLKAIQKRAKELADAAKELADAAQEDATEALNKIGDMGSDGKLDPSEKLTVKREFVAAWNEKDKSEGLIDKCYDANNNLLISSTTLNTYINAFVALGTYLNGSTNWDAGSTVCSDTYRATDGNLPSWIQSDNMSTTNNITGSTWRTKWSDFYAARTAVMTALSEAAKNAADEAFEEAVTKVNYFVGASVPTPPYKEGDLWLKTSTDNPTLAQAEAGEMFVCVVSRSSGTGQMSDWANMKEITEKRDPRILLAALVSMVYSYNGGYLREKDTNAYQRICLGQRNYHAEGDLAYYDSTVYQYRDGWEEISNETLREAFKAVYEVIGQYNLRIFRTRPTITKQMYDMVCSTVTFTDSYLPVGNAYKTVEGGVNIEMWNGDDWEVLQRSMQSLIENLQGYVRAVAYAQAGDVVNASGFITSSDWATLFSQATDADGNIIAQAHLGTYVTKDSNGVIESGVKIKADKIDFEGGTLKIGADNINFIGKTVINNKFIVDADGNVTMNNFTANDATIKGNIYTPYLTINSYNIGDYATYTSDSYGNFYLIDIENTGLNIQIDIETFNPYTYIKFPTGVKWLGAEANIYANGYCCIRDLSVINGVSANKTYKTYHPILRKGQRIKIKCIKDGGIYRWIPEFYTDISQMNYPVVLAQCTCETGIYANGFQFISSFNCLQSSGDFTFERLGEGRYKITKPSDWTGIYFGSGGYPTMGNVVIQLNNVGCYYDNGQSFAHRKATLLECDTDYFIVGVADDDTANDGSFGFTIWQFYGPYNSFIV